jgi:peroxiredoxin
MTSDDTPTGTLGAELARRRRRVAETFPEASLRTIAQAIERLEMLQVAETSIQVGDTLPDFALPDAEGREVTSDQLLARAPLVLSFFRGSWCPYCDATFRAMEAARPEIAAAGGTLVGICPERPEELRRTIERYAIHFPLLSDRDNRVAALCGLRWEVNDAHVEMLAGLGVDLPARQASADWALPLPATYIVSADGVVRYVHARADWRYRAEPADLVAALRRLAGG